MLRSWIHDSASRQIRTILELFILEAKDFFSLEYPPTWWCSCWFCPLVEEALPYSLLLLFPIARRYYIRPWVFMPLEQLASLKRHQPLSHYWPWNSPFFSHYYWTALPDCTKILIVIFNFKFVWPICSPFVTLATSVSIPDFPLSLISEYVNIQARSSLIWKPH